MGNCLIMLASVFYYLIKMYFNIQKLYQYVWWDADCKLDNTSRSLHEMVWFTVRTLKSSHKITLGESAQLRNLGTLRGFSFTIQLFSAGKLHKSYFSCLTVSLLFFSVMVLLIHKTETVFLQIPRSIVSGTLSYAQSALGEISCPSSCWCT